MGWPSWRTGYRVPQGRPLGPRDSVAQPRRGKRFHPSRPNAPIPPQHPGYPHLAYRDSHRGHGPRRYDLGNSSAPSRGMESGELGSQKTTDRSERDLGIVVDLRDKSHRAENPVEELSGDEGHVARTDQTSWRPSVPVGWFIRPSAHRSCGSNGCFEGYSPGSMRCSRASQ